MSGRSAAAPPARRTSGVVTPEEQEAPSTSELADEAAQAVREHELDRRELLIGKRISAGSFALVYAGRYRGELVAIKVLRSDRVSPKDYKTYTKEVHLIQSFNHPHVLRFVGVCCEPPHVCIVTEFLERGSLFQLLHPRPRGPDEPPKERLSLLRVLVYAEGIAKGMQYLHSCAVIHRDLKSGNILLDTNDVIKVADFGVARRLSSRSESMTAETGTYRWMAPEVIRHSRYDHRVDVFSFGIVCWEMLSGQLPYDQLSPIQAAAAVVVENLRPAVEGNMPAGTPPQLTALMCTCWDVEPSKRPDFDAIIVEVAAMRAAEAARRASGEDSGRSGRLAAALASGPHAGAASPDAASFAAAQAAAERAEDAAAAEAKRRSLEAATQAHMRHLSDLDERPDDELASSAIGIVAPAAMDAAPDDGARARRRRKGWSLLGCCTQPGMGQSL